MVAVAGFVVAVAGFVVEVEASDTLTCSRRELGPFVALKNMNTFKT